MHAGGDEKGGGTAAEQVTPVSVFFARIDVPLRMDTRAVAWL